MRLCPGFCVGYKVAAAYDCKVDEAVFKALHVFFF